QFGQPMRKTFVILIFATCFLTSLDVVGETKSAVPSADPLQALAQDFWQWRARYQPFSKDDIPRIEHPPGPRDWSAASIASQRAALKTFETRWRDLNDQGWDRSQQVDYRLMGSAIARVRWELDLNLR